MLWLNLQLISTNKNNRRPCYYYCNGAEVSKHDKCTLASKFYCFLCINTRLQLFKCLGCKWVRAAQAWEGSNLISSESGLSFGPVGRSWQKFRPYEYMGSVLPKLMPAWREDRLRIRPRKLRTWLWTHLDWYKSLGLGSKGPSWIRGGTYM